MDIKQKYNIPSGLKINLPSCKFCGEYYTVISLLEEHEKSHHSRSKTKFNENRKTFVKFPCDQCEKMFTEERNLKQHILIYHSKLNRNYIISCKYCGKNFLRSGNLKKHIIEHHKEQEDYIRVPCPHCPKAFSRADSVYRHIIRMHEKINKHLIIRCDICGKKFMRIQDLKRHTYIHKPNVEGVKYQCKHCKKWFSRVDSRNRHSRHFHRKKSK